MNVPTLRLCSAPMRSHFPFNFSRIMNLGCPDVSKYEYIIKIGQGTFGEVFKAKDRKKRSIVAIKRVMVGESNEGIPITCIREIRLLQKLQHPNIVKLIEICTSQSSATDRSKAAQKFYLVFEFCEHDLAGILSNASLKFSLGQLKFIMWQLLNALFFIHGNNVIHRDVKTSNILVTKNGVLKLADFGLARSINNDVNEDQKYTNRVVTLWYRPPELLLGERNYGPAIDIWGAGCIMAELWTRTPIMQGSNEQHQLKLIIDLCGSINSDSYPGVEKLELYRKIDLKQGEERKIKKRLKPFIKENDALDLLDQLLIINPVQRIDSDTALLHSMFYNETPREELKLENCGRSNFEMFSKRNPAHKGNIIPKPMPKKPRLEEEYCERVF